jgi:hypothetical protein
MFSTKTNSNFIGMKTVASRVFVVALCSILAIAEANATDACGPLPGTYLLTASNSDGSFAARQLLRACECFALFCSMKGLQQVLVVVLRGLDGWSEGEPVGVE